LSRDHEPRPKGFLHDPGDPPGRRDCDSWLITTRELIGSGAVIDGPRPATGSTMDHEQDADADADDDDPLFQGLLRAVARAPSVDATLTDEAEPRPGAVLDGCFRIVRPLGRGGMGVVYLADHLQLERKVALKLHAQATGSAGTSRLLREARSMASVVHDNVITVYDVGTVDGQVYIAMEYVDGGTLRDWLARTPRTWREIVAVFAAAARGLLAAHAAGLVHRDFKPDNVLVGLDGRVRVADFGLARAAEGEEGVRLRWRDGATSTRDARSVAAPTEPGSATARGGRPSRAVMDGLRLTATGALVGTPAYMAPEQHEGRAADVRSDQFAFCVSLYEALYGERPFRGKTLVELVTSMIDGEPAAPPRAREVPSRIRRALQRGLSRDPAARFPDMGALLRELEHDPARARRRWLGVGAAVVLTAVGVGVGQRVATRDPCAGGVERMGPVWGPSRGAALERALAEQGGPVGVAVGPRVRARLDVHAETWMAAYRDACEATRLRQVQSEEALDLRMACLDERREELAALVEVLAAGDAEVAARADKASLALSPIEPCADLEALRRVDRIAAGDREAAEAVRRGVARAKSQLGAGRYAESLALADEALGRARALGYPALEAAALERVAEARTKLGDPEAAVRAYEGALTSAVAAGDDRAALMALLGLLYVEGYQLERFEPGERWLRQVDAWLRRVGDGGLLVVRRHLYEALLRREQGRLTDAVASLRRAREVIDALPAAEQAQEARLSLTAALAVTLRVQGEVEASLAAHAEAVALAEALYGPEHPSFATELNNAGAARLQHGDVAGSEDLLRRALEIRAASFGPAHRSVLEGRINLAIVATQLGRHDEAVELLREAERHAEGADPKIRVELLEILGGVRTEQGRHDEAEAVLRRALDQARAAWPADDPRVLQVLANLANLANRRERYAEAEALAREGLHAAAGSSRESLGMVEGYLQQNLGDALSELGRTAEACTAYAAALASMETNLGPEHPHLHAPLRGLRECLANGALEHSELRPHDRERIEVLLREPASR
jgi:eukaryotic-like serine/threonine-protein kinase